MITAAQIQDALRIALRNAIFNIPDEYLVSRDIIFNAIDSILAQSAPPEQVEASAKSLRDMTDADFDAAHGVSQPADTQPEEEWPRDRCGINMDGLACDRPNCHGPAVGCVARPATQSDERELPPLPSSSEQPKPRAQFLALAEQCGARITGKPDASEPIEIVFTVQAWRRFDSAAVEQAPAQTLPDGFVLVPREPTEEMIKAGQLLASGCDLWLTARDAKEVFQSMLNAASSQQGDEK